LVLKQCEPGGLGQRALESLFGNKTSPAGLPTENAPSSALPLMIGIDGKCNLSGGRGFDEKVVKAFLDDIYETNLAALESLSVATTVMEKVARARARLSEHLARSRGSKFDQRACHSRINLTGKQKCCRRSQLAPDCPT
jgi:hypothetical protein